MGQHGAIQEDMSSDENVPTAVSTPKAEASCFNPSIAHQLEQPLWRIYPSRELDGTSLGVGHA